MIHAGLAALFCIGVLCVKGRAFLCLWPAVFYISREFAQAEYRYVLSFCNGSFATMPTFAGFYPVVWNTKSMLDWILPLTVSLLFWLIAEKSEKKREKERQAIR